VHENLKTDWIYKPEMCFPLRYMVFSTEANFGIYHLDIPCALYNFFSLFPQTLLPESMQTSKEGQLLNVSYLGNTG